MKKDKEQLMKKFKEFSKINLTKICKDKGIRVENLYHGTTSLENMNIVRSELQKRLLKWLSEDE